MKKREDKKGREKKMLKRGVRGLGASVQGGRKGGREERRRREELLVLGF